MKTPMLLLKGLKAVFFIFSTENDRVETNSNAVQSKIDM
jgi:hypothetical protein